MEVMSDINDDNPWGREALTVNPYRRSAFVIVRARVDEPEKRKIAQRAASTEKVVRNAPGSHSPGGKPVGPAEINQALASLLNPATRILDELLIHHPVCVEWERLSNLEADVDLAIGRKIGVPMGHDLNDFPTPF